MKWPGDDRRFLAGREGDIADGISSYNTNGQFSSFNERELGYIESSF